MIYPVLFSILVIVALLLGNIDVAHSQDRGVRMIVVFHDQASLLESFRGLYQTDERERLDPDGWSYLDRNVAGAVQRPPHMWRAQQLWFCPLIQPPHPLKLRALSKSALSVQTPRARMAGGLSASRGVASKVATSPGQDL